MFTRRTFHGVFVLFLAMVLIMAGCCLLPPPTPNTYTITATAGSGGGIAPTGAISITEGASQTFTITPDEGYQVSDVLVDGASVGAVTAYTFTNVQQDHTISASFIKTVTPITPTVIKYTITATAGTGGSITPEGSIKVKKGSNQTFTITPGTCYQIADVLVDGVSIGAESTYTFTNVQQDHTISASFVVSGTGVHNIDTSLAYATIQEAIDAATDGETIVVCPGNYKENIVFDGRNITLRSSNPLNENIVVTTIINGGESDSVIKFINGDTSTLQGFTIRNGMAHLGGGIYVNGTSPTIIGNTIIGNRAVFDGGGIYLYDSNSTISDNTITGNTADAVDSDGGGGIYVKSSSSTISGNTITGNIGKYRGGGIYIYDSSFSNITDNTITCNTAGTSGGGIFVRSSSLTIENNTIASNIALNFGGGIYGYGQSSPNIIGNTIIGNVSIIYGGGIYVGESSPNIDSNTIMGNETLSGGGIYAENGSAIIIDNTITGNIVAEDGGGICLYYSDSTIMNNNIISNTAKRDGGGIDVYYSYPIISNNTITGNTADAEDGTGGGGIFVDLGSNLLPDTDWGIARDSIPTGDPLVPVEGVEFEIAGNTFLGNKHRDPLDYTEGAHVYFE